MTDSMTDLSKHEQETIVYIMKFGGVHPKGQKMPARIISEFWKNPENTQLYREALKKFEQEKVIICLEDSGYDLANEELKILCQKKAFRAVINRPQFFMKIASFLKKKVPRKSDTKELQESIRGTSFSPEEKKELKKESKNILQNIPTTKENKDAKELLKESIED